MANRVAIPAPQDKLVTEDFTGTARMKGWMRGISEFVGAITGSIPAGSISAGSLGADGASTTTFLREDLTFAVPSYPVGANPITKVGSTATNGTAVTFMRSDAAPALDLAANYVFTGDVSAATVVSVGGFGCNGKTAQTAATVDVAVAGTAGGAYTATEQQMINDLQSLVNQMRQALVDNGIAV